MLKNYLQGAGAKVPTFTSRKILRNVLMEEFPIAEWVVWEQLLEEEPRSQILASVRLREVSERSVPKKPNKVGRELTIYGEFRLVARADDQGSMRDPETPSDLNLLADGLSSWMFDASHGNEDIKEGVVVNYPDIKSNLEEQGIYDFNIGKKRFNTDSDFTQLCFQEFSIKVYVERGA
jgi:hypothetical protein